MFYEKTFHQAGGRQPVDGFDSLCKAYHQNCVCLMKEQVCDPLTIVYKKVANPQTITGLSNDEISFICENANGEETCETSVCIIETAFMRDYFQLANTFFMLPDSEMFKHEYGFDPEVECASNRNKNGEIDQYGVVARADKCCGKYVSGKKPFSGDSGMLECCDDGEIRSFGTCF